MPNILKRFTNMTASKYVFPDARELPVFSGEELPPPPAPSEEAEDASPQEPAPYEEPGDPEPQPSPIDFAQVQADAILADARQAAEQILLEAREEAARELEDMRRQAASEGFQQGLQEGLAAGRLEARQQLEKDAARQGEQVKAFLEGARLERELLMEKTKEDMKELALTIAEKVIRVSLRSSSDILIRMIEAATAKKRRCEWVQIYIADCDAKTNAQTVPELIEAMRHLSDRVRVIPMADDESGTCIIEMPDEIIDASVSTQLDNLRGVLENGERDGGR